MAFCTKPPFGRYDGVLPDVVKSHGAYSKRESTDYPDQMRWIRGNSAEWLIHIPEIDLYFLLVYLSHNNFLEHVFSLFIAHGFGVTRSGLRENS